MTLAGARRPARGRDRHPRSPLEDPLDAQLRPAVGDAEAARGDGEDARRGRRRAARPAPELGQRSQLGLDQGAVGDEGGGQGGPGAARGLRPRDGRPRSSPRSSAPSAGGGSSPSGSSRTSRNSAGTPSGATSSSSRPCTSSMEPVIELIRGYIETDYDYPSTMGALQGGHRRGLPRDPRRTRAAMRSTRCARPTRSTCAWRR